MDISLPQPIQTPVNIPAIVKSDNDAVSKPTSNTAPVIVSPQDNAEPQDPDQEHIAAIEQVIRSQPDLSAGTSFTIFKDATGQYITRIRNKDDGSVTYVPEPEMFRNAINSFVDMSA